MKQNWYQKTTDQVLAELDSSSEGLSDKEAAARLKKHGPNSLPEAKQSSAFQIFLKQFTSPLVYLLFLVAIIVLVLGEFLDASVILFILFFNAIIGAVQEGKAQNTLQALKKLVTTQALVRRGGKEYLIDDHELVPGDVVVVREGDRVPADARVLKIVGATANESSLTGESTSVVKTVEPIEGKGSHTLAAADQTNMIFKGSSLVAGSAEAVIVATGSQTEIGKLSKTIADNQTEIPLQKNIRHISHLIVVVVAIASVLLFIVGMFRGLGVLEMAVITVSLAVSIIPEGLPVVITLILANGVWRMSQRNALIKRLGAVEALGQASVIAVDKTGTITKNELVVTTVVVKGKTFTVTGSGYNPEGTVQYQGKAVSPPETPEIILAAKIACFANAKLFLSADKESWSISGDPTEAALLVFAQKSGLNIEDIKERHPVTQELEFDYKRKFRAVVYKEGTKHMLAALGSPEAIAKLSGQRSSSILPQVEELSKEGLRVIAFAFTELHKSSVDFEDIPKLTFGGLYAMQDTMHREVPAAVEDVQAAKLQLVMITGDYPETARAIARSAGIYKKGDTVMTGKELQSLSPSDLQKAVKKATVFARVTPEHKMQIVKALKAQHMVVAMTGDGVNDVPPMVAADLGIAMGKTGTDVTKESADMILLDDNFSTIAAAVEEGRNIYQTIKRALLYLFSTNVGEFLVIAVALLLAWPLPVTAVQILWLNFVTDGFITIAFATEPKQGNLLRLPYRKPTKYIIDKATITRLFPMAVIMSFGTLAVFYFYKDVDYLKAKTMALTVLAAFQWFNAFNVRFERRSAFTKLLANKWLLAAVGFVVLAHVAIIHTNLGRQLLGTTSLSLQEWGIAILLASSVLWYEELAKYVKKIVYRHKNKSKKGTQ